MVESLRGWQGVRCNPQAVWTHSFATLFAAGARQLLV
jgi:hypothetical protein